MAIESLNPFFEDLRKIVASGCDQIGVASFASYTAIVDPPSEELATLHDYLHTTLEAEADEVPLPLLSLFEAAIPLRSEQIELPKIVGEIEPIKPSAPWSTQMPSELLYALVPETRPFAKRAKIPQQIDYIEICNQRGYIADLRLLPIFLKKLVSKTASDPLADTIAKIALPAYGPEILPDLWPSLVPDSRTFLAAYRIDVEATLARLIEKSGKKTSDKSNQVMKAVSMLLEDVLEGSKEVSVDSLPMLRLGLKYAPDAAYRKRIAETIVSLGVEAKECLPDLIDTFEKGGLTRDHHFIRLLVVLDKDSPKVAEALLRALEDRDNTVRLLSAFNLGQIGAPASTVLRRLEEVSETDPDAKVREQATRTLNKLKQRLALPDEVEAALI